jgi:hypothetical protein
MNVLIDRVISRKLVPFYNTKLLLLIIIVSLIVANKTFAQNEKSEYYNQIEKKYKKLKDSLARVYRLIPAVSSVMVNHKQFEVNFFNSLISANRYRDANMHLNSLNARETYFYSTVQLTCGVSKNARFNVGIDINSVFGRIDQDENSSLFKVFNSDIEGNSRYARSITSVSSRIRWRPLKNNYKFVVQSSLNFPTGISIEKQSVLGYSQVYFVSQFLYNQPLSKRLFLFPQLSFQYGFKNNQAASVYYLPLSLYLSYLVPQKTILFVLTNYVPIFSKENNFRYNSFTLQLGGGVQYQFSPYFLVNAYYANNINGKNYGDFESYNLGFRYITTHH